MLPLRSRVGPVLALMVMAPVCAEYLSAYLAGTGDAAVMVGGLVVLGPLYGGAALLVRELSLRTGRGWPGALLLATGFGVAMPTLVDLTAWAESFPTVPYWQAMRDPTLVEPLGLAAFPMLTWVGGHVMLSIAAPIALLDALAPRHRDRRLLGPAGIAVVGALLVWAAVLIRLDPQTLASPSPVQQSCAAVVVLALVTLALSPLGAPLARRPGQREASPTRGSTPRRVLLLALPVALALEVMPFGWGGAAAYAAVLVLAGGTLVRSARHRWWGLGHATALAVAVVLARSLVGFLSPLPPGVTPTAKVVQGVVLLVLVLLVCRTAWVRAREAELAERGHVAHERGTRQHRRSVR